MEKDVEAPFKKVSEIGYKQVEFAGYFGKSAVEIKSLLKKYALMAAATHVNWGEFKKDPDKLCKETVEYGIKYMVIAWINPLDRITYKQYRKIALHLNKGGKACQKVGVTLLYHNHDFEFKGDEGRIPYDLILNHTDSNTVKQELDLFWILKAKKDPIQYLTKYTGRFTHFHVKDMDKKGKMVDVGKGVIDF